MKLRLLLLLPGLALLASCAMQRTEVKLTQLEDRVRVEVDGKPFTEYIFHDSARRPYCYPVLSPDGTQLVRDFPMKKDTGEDEDHPHHRGLWFAHSSVNGVDFWNDPGAGSAAPANKGRIVHDKIVEASSGAVGTIHTTEKWIAGDESLTCTSDTTIRFRGTPDARFVDWETTLHAPADKPLLIGDNKDGTMAVRLAQWMTMPHKYKTAQLPGVGHFETSAGKKDGDAWGTKGDWCDTYAPRDGKTYGIAIFDHPQNLRHPTWWMARDYGLFGANPFGQHDFEAAAKHPAGIGNYTIPAGGSLTLKYRFYIHSGDTAAARVGERYATYASGN